MQNNITKIFIALFICFFVTGCVKEDKFSDSRQGSFDALWSLIDQRYCFFENAEREFGLDWDKVYKEYSAKVDNRMTNSELFNLCGKMLNELRDGHVNLSSTFGTTYYWKWNTGYPMNFSDSLQRNYLGADFILTNGIKYTILDGEIGYIYISSFANGFGEGNLNVMLNSLAACKGLIIDIRNNGGGMLTAAEDLASHFSNTTHKFGYIQHKTGSGRYSFSEPKPLYLDPSAGRIWGRPVVLLTNRSVYSTANYFTMIMKGLPNVTVVGDKTGGGSGLPFNSVLPNGWTVRFSACPILDADGQQVESGIAPDIKVNISSQDWNRGVDTIIEKGIALIKGETEE